MTRAAWFRGAVCRLGLALERLGIAKQENR